MATTISLSHGLSVLLAPALLAALSACGPAPSDEAASAEVSASVASPIV